MLNDSNVTDYKAWSDIYVACMSVQVKLTHKPKRVYISGDTRRLICKRNAEEQVTIPADREELNNDIKRSAAEDKRRWHRQQVQRNMTCRKRWQGIRLMHEDFKPKTYAKNDKNNQPVRLHERAEATAEYLAEKQWAPPTQKIGSQSTTDYVHHHLQRKRNNNPHIDVEEGPITLAELQRVIRKMKRRKAPGPDNITSDWLKDLDEDMQRK